MEHVCKYINVRNCGEEWDGAARCVDWCPVCGSIRQYDLVDGRKFNVKTYYPRQTTLDSKRKP